MTSAGVVGAPSDSVHTMACDRQITHGLSQTLAGDAVDCVSGNGSVYFLFLFTVM